MSNLLDAHAVRLKNLILRHGRTVILTDPDGNDFSATALWNDVEHSQSIEGFSEEPTMTKDSLYFDRDSLETAGISPGEGWKATGSPNRYDAEATYLLEIPKKDYQLPGALFFISKIVDSGNTGWAGVGQ